MLDAGGIHSTTAARAAGISYRMLDTWATKGLVVPSVANPAGKGTMRLYALQDVLALRLVRELRDAGLPLQRVRKVAETLRTWPEGWPPRGRLVTDGADAWLVSDDALVSVLQRPGQAAWACVLDLGRLAREVTEAFDREQAREVRKVA